MAKLLCISNCYWIGRFGMQKIHSEGEIYDGEIYDHNNEQYYWVIYNVDSKGAKEGHCFDQSKFMLYNEWLALEREKQMKNIIDD